MCVQEALCASFCVIGCYRCCVCWRESVTGQVSLYCLLSVRGDTFWKCIIVIDLYFKALSSLKYFIVLIDYRAIVSIIVF